MILSKNSTPWPEGLYPVAVRGKSDTGKWLVGSSAKITPAAGLWYESREPVLDEWVELDSQQVKATLLLPPGDYELEFKGSIRGGRTVTFTVDDPFTQLKLVPWKKEELWIREGTWDKYISGEGSYGALTMREGDIVADMGAHIGVFARRAHKAHVAKVYCWEPEPTNIAVLLKNLSMTDLDYEIQEACVVADHIEEDFVDLWMEPAGDGDMGRNALHSMIKAKGKRLARRVNALKWSEELNRTQPTILKVDVEGAELDYDWSLVPDSVREIAVELEKTKKDQPDSHTIIADALRNRGFELIRHSSGWSVMEVWKR